MSDSLQKTPENPPKPSPPASSVLAPAVPRSGDATSTWADEWMTRLEAFYNIGSRIAKFHAAPGTMLMRGHRLDEPVYRPLLREVRDRRMVIMTHIGDPDTWYHGKYAD